MGSSNVKGGDEGARRCMLAALSRAVDGGVVLVQPGGEVDFVSDTTHELLPEGLPFDDWWRPLQERIDVGLDPRRLAEGEAALDVCLPEECGGRTFFVRVFAMDDPPDRAGRLVVLKDRRTIDALQGELRFAQHMRQIALGLEQAAHDLKAPLNAMALNLALARSKLSGGHPAVVSRLDQLDREIARFARMVQALLSQSRLPSERVRRFDLTRLVREIVALMRSQARKAAVALGREVPGEPVEVVGVRDDVKQALINLVVNGLEAMPRGGRLTLSLARGNDEVVLRVRDTGCGIPPELVERVFKLHFTTKAAGTGIGLFTARSVVECMGGSLALESEAGRGTTAVVRLPLAAHEADAAARGPRAVRGPEGQRPGELGRGA